MTGSLAHHRCPHRASDLHESIADGIQAALSSGVGATRLTGQHVGTLSKQLFASIDDGTLRNALRAEEIRLHSRASRVRKTALELPGENDAGPWIREATEYERQARAIQDKLKGLEKNSKSPQKLSDEIPIDAVFCARALAVLRRVETNAPGNWETRFARSCAD